MRTHRLVVPVSLAAGALLAVVPGVRAEDAPARAAWDFPKEIAAAGRKVSLAEPAVIGRDAAAGTVALRFPVQVQDGVGRITWGMAEATATPHFDLSARLVLVDGVKAGNIALPQLADNDREDIAKALPDALPKELVLRLELLTASAAFALTDPSPAPKLSMSAPEILVRRTPAVLVQIDGEIVKEALGDFPFEYVLNTSADLFRDPKSDTWHLLADGAWLEAKSLQGPWKLSAQPPILLSQLPVTHPRGHIRMFIPGTPEFATRTGGKKPAPPAVVPEVIVRDKPAELVVLRGDPLFTMVPGVKLLTVANTESDLVYHPKTAQFFLCLSGRWFTAEDVNGPWKESLGSLPEEFAKIPRDHMLGHVVWCVAGTPEAAEAAALASIEERITLSKATSLTVQYEGKDPRTVPIDSTDLKFATNSDDEVLVAEGSWWCCARGVWFRSDDGRGSWTPATTLPKGVASLPEGSALFPTRFVRPLGVTEAGYGFAASGGYQGVFVWKNAPVHGTGYSRRGVLRAGNWYPYPRTWGENRWYDPIAGVFQPRNVRYTAEGRAVADEWSPYTASYGRVRQFADRYGQGGRRMYTFTADSGRFDASADRPDPFGSWGTQLKDREGLKFERFPLGDRSMEKSNAEPAVVADDKGTVWRAGPKGIETYKDKDWAASDSCGDAEKRWIETFTRIRARPDQLRAWAEKRRAALPVNPTVTK
jgi:hypothetical protein